MNNKRFLSLLLVLLLLLSGCRFGMPDTEELTGMPVIGAIPLEGHYRFEELIPFDPGRFVDRSGFLDFTASFSLEGARIGQEAASAPSYLAKIVDTYDYFRLRHQMDPSRFGLEEGRLEVVNITQEGRSFYPILVLDAEHIALVKGENFIRMRRFVPQGTGDNGFPGTVPPENGQESPSPHSVTEARAGVLLGLRAPRHPETGASSYRTLWITNDGEIQEVYEVQDILFPRKEFWRMRVERIPTDSGFQETVVSHPVSQAPPEDKALEEAPLRRIQLEFVGNNVFGVHVVAEDTQYRRMVSVDEAAALQGLDIQDLAGEAGRESFLHALTMEKSRNSRLQEASVNLPGYFRSVALHRFHGHWHVTGGIALEGQWMDLPVAMKPSTAMVAYDGMTVSFDQVQERVPQALDAFQAPGNSFLLVRTPRYLMMYRILPDGQLSERPLQMVEISESETIIMAEWARGEFVARWTDMVEELGRKIIFVQNRR